MPQEQTHLTLARAQFSTTGLAVLDSLLLANADPTLWPSAQQEMLGRFSQRSLIAAFYTTHPTSVFFEFRVDGGGYVGVARSLINIEARIEELTGLKASGIKTFIPGSTLHAETSRIPELRTSVNDEFLGFNADDFEKSLPRHDCHVRREGMAKLARYRALQ